MNKKLITAAVFAGLFASPVSQAENTQTYNIPLSRPGDPIHLDADLSSGSIRVIGEDRDDVEIEVAGSGGERRIITPSGAKPIPVSSYALDIEEEDNQIEIDTEWGSGTVDLTVRVPRRANLELKTVNDGDISVTDVTGSLDLDNVNGSITATGIRGTVIAETVNEDIIVELLEVTSDEPMALENGNGNITVSLPPDFGAELWMTSRQQEIYSDFEVELRPNEPVFKRDQQGNRIEFELEQKIIALINGGGTRVTLETRQGEIHIRKVMN
ncbi:MAG: hypothetical protein QNJ40_06700 [Xanthomonadales bacterium]|nr:hypothetical protein [Xanthomonadales bacterium]